MHAAKRKEYMSSKYSNGNGKCFSSAFHVLGSEFGNFCGINFTFFWLIFFDYRKKFHYKNLPMQYTVFS